MNAPVLSRRALLGASSAAIGAVALPALAEAGIPASVAADPDAELFDLIRRYAAAFAARNAHAGVHAAALARYEAAVPPRPAALTHTFLDSISLLHSTGRHRGADGRLYAHFTPDDIACLRKAGPVMQPAWDDDGNPLPPVPNSQGEARRQQILAAHEGWKAEKRALADRVGLTAAEAEDDRLYEALGEAREAVQEAVPATLVGLRAKARWLVGLDDAENDHEAFARQVAAFGAVS